jgi:hypothetical protein
MILEFVAQRATLNLMKMAPISLRLDKELYALLMEGRKRTPLKPAELIRRTLRQHLSKTIETESGKPRLTNIDPLPKGVMAKVYKQIAHEGWDEVEKAAVAAQPAPSFED